MIKSQWTEHNHDVIEVTFISTLQEDMESDIIIGMIILTAADEA